MSCAEVWIEYVVKHFGVSEIGGIYLPTLELFFCFGWGVRQITDLICLEWMNAVKNAHTSYFAVGSQILFCCPKASTCYSCMLCF